ncbi:hypothetical protein [Chryseobacterium gleum]|uniref:hypothetical protein n=1 Tax=Chryseobacterium gleum TaxID=250 RepID=UPI0035E44070
MPEEYIDFVTNIGCFGFGPNEGLLPLNQYNDLRHRILENNLQKEFPFTEKKEDDELYHFEYDSLLNGVILISDCGGGDFEVLVVNGKEYGNVWGDYRVSCNGIMPLTNIKNEKLSFLDWYNQFLEKQIDYYEKNNPQKNKNILSGINSNKKFIKPKNTFSVIFSKIFK